MSKNTLSFKSDCILSQVQSALESSIKQIAEDLKQKSIQQVPVDSGELKDDCEVTFEKDGNHMVATVCYSLPYAIIQHERLDFDHPSGGKAKFLEDPYNENMDNYQSAIAGAILKELKT